MSKDLLVELRKALEATIINAKTKDRQWLILSEMDIERYIARTMINFSLVSNLGNEDRSFDVSIRYNMELHRVDSIKLMESIHFEDPQDDAQWIRKVLLQEIERFMQGPGEDYLRRHNLRDSAIYKRMLEKALGAAVVIFRADGCQGNLFFQEDGYGVSTDKYFFVVEDIDVTAVKSTIRLAYGNADTYGKPEQQKRVEVSIFINADDIINWKSIQDFVERQVVTLMRPQVIAIHP